MLTPLSLFNNFDASLKTEAVIKTTHDFDGVTVETVSFLGRDTGSGRIEVAAAFAYDALNPALETVLIFPDSAKTIDDDILKMFVKRGYSALMVDYRGEWEGCDFYTRYPENVAYANTAKCGRRKDFVDESADLTSWYEWVGIGIYARKYIAERVGEENIAVVGIRDGGEIVWKLGTVCKFSCIIPVCAAGWKAYEGISKYLPEEPELNEERYRFIAGIDSQGYAPFVKSPVLMLCSTNDIHFDYDRAYDTYSRINSAFFENSAISYSVQCNSSIGATGTVDMFLFLDKHLKNRQVFIPKPATVSVEVDGNSNLIARATFDNQGIVDNCKVFLSEDSLDSALREWTACPLKQVVSESEQEFFLDVYEKTTSICVFCHVMYSNGFTVWSKIVVKKIGGSFHNTQSKCRVLYSGMDGTEVFSIADPAKLSIGGVFFTDETTLPKLVEKAKGVEGVYSPCGLTTMRFSNPRFAPSAGSLLSIDVFCDETANVEFSLCDMETKETYVAVFRIIGGVWQSVVANSTDFKTESGAPLAEFSNNLKFTVACAAPYAINNIMWL